MARTIGRKNRNLVKRLVTEELEKTRGKPWLPTPPRQTIEEIVVEKLPVELWDTWEGADDEIRRIIWDTVSEGHASSSMKEVAGETDRRGEIFRQCMRKAGYGTHRGSLTQRAKEPEEPKRKVLRPSEAIQMVEWFVVAYRREVGFPQTAASALNEIQRGLSEGWLEYDIERSGVLVPY